MARSKPWWIGWRLVALVILAVHVVGTLGYVLIEGWSAWDAFYMTVITVTTVGYGEVHPMSQAGRVFTVFVLLTGVIFRAGTLEAAWHIFQGLAVPPNPARGQLAPVIIVPLVAFLLPASQDIIERLTRKSRPWLAALVGIGLLALLLELGGRNDNGFAYFYF